MAITFESVIQQILNELGAVKGATPAQADANYTASPSTATVIGPDFLPSQVQDALAATISKTVECIASVPHHPERQRFADVTAALSNLDAIPRVGSGGATVIGVPGFVRDGSDGKAVLPAPLDAVRSYTRFAATIYAGQDAYLYAINGNRIEHTRTTVIVEVCVFTRPTTFTGDINLDDWHEAGLVAGAVEILATKESMFAALHDAAKQRRDAHLAEIRNYAPPELYGKAQSAPSST